MNHHEDWMDRHQEGGGETERISKTKGYKEAVKKHAMRVASKTPSPEKALKTVEIKPGFGSKYDKKGIKRLLKKSENYRLKHF